MRFRRQGSPADGYGDVGVEETLMGSDTWWVLNRYTCNPSDYYTYTSVKTCWDELHKGPPYRSGGPLSIRELHEDRYVVKNTGVYTNPTGSWRYRGGFLNARLLRTGLGWELYDINNFAVEEPAGEGANFGDAYGYGATAWNLFKPGRPSISLGVALGELKDMPKMLKTTAKGFHNLWKSMGGSPTGFGPKGVANHWLNTQFGWLPFISDVRKLYTTSRKLDRILNYIRKNNGKWVRRGGIVENENTSEIVSSSDSITSHWPILVTQMYPNSPSSGSHVIKRQETDVAWFDACFRYWIPDIKSPSWSRRAKMDIFGLTPNPSLVWNLTPWSWLADWFTNAGDCIANTDEGWAENLAAKYAYVMRTTEISYTTESVHDIHGGPVTAEWSSGIKSKSRIAASPFGFGLDPSQFSGRQWSILGALGVSRL